MFAELEATRASLTSLRSSQLRMYSSPPRAVPSLPVVTTPSTHERDLERRNAQLEARVVDLAADNDSLRKVCPDVWLARAQRAL